MTAIGRKLTYYRFCIRVSRPREKDSYIVTVTDTVIVCSGDLTLAQLFSGRMEAINAIKLARKAYNAEDYPPTFDLVTYEISYTEIT